jgi:GT2 family glycosyltransferase
MPSCHRRGPRSYPDAVRRPRLAVVIPTVAAHGLLGRCIEAVLAQDGIASDILLIANGPGFSVVGAYWARHGIEVRHHVGNLGVGSSWNHGCRWAWRRDHDAVILLNDDLVLTDRATLTRFRAAVDRDQRNLYFLAGRGFGVACVSRAVWDDVGPFDEGFWPAYHEDNDMHRRASLAGIGWRDVPGDSEHFGSATIRTDPRIAALNLRTFPLTQQRYLAKWGGLPGEERFTIAWDGAPATPSVRDLVDADGHGLARRRSRVPAARRRPRMLIVIGVVGGFALLADVLDRLLETTHAADVLIIDNGSQPPLDDAWLPRGVRVVRNPSNRGTYALFGQALDMSRGYDLVAFLHSDLRVHEVGWDDRVRAAFVADERLGLIGFVGSSEIDPSGGRGGGTILNFSGVGEGTKAEDHGRRIDDLRPAAVVDGCSMVFRRSALASIGRRRGFPPHHFYDRLQSCQLLEAGWRIGVLGVACDHLGNRTAGSQLAWKSLARRWAVRRGLEAPDDDWELALYREAERQFLAEWRDAKAFIPLTVLPDWSIARPV